MRRTTKHAFGRGWITRDIFAGSKVIDAGAEISRKRIITDAEESRLLENCQVHEMSRQGKVVEWENKYLKAIIILALDSAMRKSEIL